MKQLKLFSTLALILPLFMAFGCSDNSSDSSDDIPANLVGTWWFESAAINDDPVSSFSEVAHDENAIEGSVTFYANGTWSGAEYGAGEVILVTLSGTFNIDGNSIAITRTVYNGEPVSPPAEEDWGHFSILDDVLTLTAIETIDSETYTLIAIYIKQS